MSGRKQTHSTSVGILVVCIKEDLSSLPICIFCKDIMPLFSIHKKGSGYPVWLVDEEAVAEYQPAEITDFCKWKLFIHFSSLKRNAISGLQCLCG